MTETYYQKNKEKLCQKAIEYYAKNKEAISQRRREKYHANPEPRKEQRRKWYSENRTQALQYYVDRKEHYRNKRLQREYGITMEQYKEMLIKQNECCAICKNKRPLRVDHNHLTKTVRGLLCDKCNVTLGLLDENITIAENLISYLKKDK
jgi:hypothetical protein